MLKRYYEKFTPGDFAPEVYAPPFIAVELYQTYCAKSQVINKMSLYFQIKYD
jgi:hypothetical protein